MALAVGFVPSCVRAAANEGSGRQEWEGAAPPTLEGEAAERLRLFFSLHSHANEQVTEV